MCTYRVTFNGFKAVKVDAWDKKEAAQLAKEHLICWGWEPKGRPQIEVIA